MTKPLNIYIDASPITEARVSGIGHMTAELIRGLDTHVGIGTTFNLTLVIAADKKQYLERWGYKNVRVATIPLRQRVVNLIWKCNLLPPMDLFLGKGVYVFPNYKNWRLAFSKSVTFICDIGYKKFPNFVEPKNLEFLSKNMKKWVSRTDRIAAISNDAKGDIIEHLHVSSGKLSLVPCGVDLSHFKPQVIKASEPILKQIGVKPGYILYIGNVEPRKNIGTVIDAYCKLPASVRLSAPLVLVGGGGWLNEPIIEQIKKAQAEGFNIIRPDFYIPDTELPALIAGAGVLVHPALYEGFGISPLQAMASGVPVIVSNNSSLPEVVGDAGILLEATDVAGWSDKIEEVLSKPVVSRGFIRKGLERARQFTWRVSADKLLTICIDLEK